MKYKPECLHISLLVVYLDGCALTRIYEQIVEQVIRTFLHIIQVLNTFQLVRWKINSLEPEGGHHVVKEVVVLESERENNVISELMVPVFRGRV